MVNFKKIPPPVSEKLLLTLEVELNKSQLTADEAADRLSYVINSYRMKEFSSFILSVLRETKSSTYEIKNLKIEEF